MARRRFRMARVLLAMLYGAGLRFTEALLLKFSDVSLGTNGQLTIYVRQNIYRNVKTPAARRKITVSRYLDDADCKLIREWIEGERIRTGGRVDANYLIFGQYAEPTASEGSDSLRQLITNAFSAGANRYCWPHLLRHGWVNRRFLDIIQRFDQHRSDPWNLQRELARLRAEVGHSDLRTTFRNYLHLPWILDVGGTRARLEQNVEVLGRFVSISEANIYKQLKRPLPGSIDTESRQKAGVTSSTEKISEDNVIARILASYQHAAPLGESRRSPAIFDATPSQKVVDEFIRSCRNLIGPGKANYRRWREDGWAQFPGLSSVATVYGLVHLDIEKVISITDELARKTCYRLLPGRTRTNTINCVRVPRRLMNEPSSYQRLSRAFTRMPVRQIVSLTNCFWQHFGPDAADRSSALRADLSTLRQIQDMLKVVGIESAFVDRVRKPSGSLLRISPGKGVTGIDEISWLFALEWIRARWSESDAVLEKTEFRECAAESLGAF